MKKIYVIIWVLFILLLSQSNAFAKEINKDIETTDVYMICDVVKTEIKDCMYLEVVMPNGEIHNYTIEDDYPEGEVELVCIKATDMENYDTYEIVALR